ncbi:hypothetical protein H0H93_002865 [Arthromyces matolae]|nr:hypothetical protein H0H93_002865 [Arthromyces matolae]
MAMFSSLEPNNTFFDPFAPLPFPSTPTSDVTFAWDRPSKSDGVSVTEAQVDALKGELASPIASPHVSYFELEEDTTKYGPSFDDFLDEPPVQEQVSKPKPIEPVVKVPSRQPSPEPVASVNPLELCLNDAEYTLPENFIDDLWGDMNHIPDLTPSTSPAPSCSTTSSVSISTPVLPSSAFTFTTPSTPDESFDPLFDIWDTEVDNPSDGDYVPFGIGDGYRNVPYTESLKKSQPSAASMGAVPTLKVNQKRKATEISTIDFKRQKIDPDVVCRINGCRHVSKTRFECSKHRETHFPGRFKCPYPDCGKIFVRSSSLSRHFKRPRNTACSSYAGTQADWGVGLVKFALGPPPWQTHPDFLDEL